LDRFIIHKKLSILSLLFLLIVCVSAGTIFKSETNHELVGDAILEFKLDTNKTFQTIQNFGASDAWSTQFVGKYWPDDEKSEIAKLLFSTANKEDGSPEGIGLTAWRFNIGAGSSEQGNNSQIDEEWRRAESFLGADGTYNWDKQSGQLWFLQAAKNYGVNTFVGFVNSPPVYLTKNGKAYSGDGLTANIPTENYKKYADFLAEVVKGVAAKTGITLNYISPFNEPQWDWKCCKQEGSPWNNDEIFKVTKEIDAAFKRYHISSKMELTEAGQIDYLYDSGKNLNRGNQINYFFNKTSEGYVGDIKSVSKKVAGHSYFSTWDVNKSISTRKLLNEKIKSTNPDLEYWMTEYCLLEDNELIKGNRRDLGIDAALYMARVIHSDLVYANASAWHWWLAISPYNYKDGLVYIDNNKFGGKHYESKMLWALGHYSRFISPKMKRISIASIDNKQEPEISKGVLQSAYTSENEIVIVLVNQLEKSQQIKLSGIPKGYKTMEVYQTSSNENDNLKKMEDMNMKQIFELPERSLMTCVLRK
tara:strand:- start:4676 stop:6274 length:1599 start_codon:yes stop_codon:yes gene_type:complete